MEKIVLATALGFGLMSTSWTAEAVNTHEHVNNAQVSTHQIQLAFVPSAVQGEAPRAAGVDQYEQAIIVHETMNNGPAEAHQKMAEDHQKMMESIVVSDTHPSVSFVVMNEHERAAVAHGTMNSGQSGTYQAMTEAYRRTINTG